MKVRLKISDFESFDDVFGDLGLKVGPRTGSNKRTKEQKEWYVVRRFLKEAIREKIVEPPFSIEKGLEPLPDFVLSYDGSSTLIEITEATHPDDQREMTEFERSDQNSILIGGLGGRFSGGLGNPGHPWANDVIEAIERKSEKSIFAPNKEIRHLVIYPNSNASFFLSNAADEDAAFKILLAKLHERRAALLNLVNGCDVHVLGKWNLFLHVLTAPSACRRADKTLA
ncbi:MAG: hypothetical protein AB7T86_07430 [Xanthobacteraceae bacterium]|uniref:hypothetical protein n=1 Tax=Pseudolabrys sp. TaxID=1960880 RepID=UPI003D0F75E3